MDLHARLRAVAYDEIDWEVPDPRAAATVVLVRDSADGIETYLMRRPLTMKFAPGMHVYPGGAVDEADYAAGITIDSIDARRASATDEHYAALLACALRETAEEAGVTLDDPNALRLIDHWVTPPFEVRRFDVRFFAARVPEGQVPHVASDESVEALWVNARAGYAAYDSGELRMLRPTAEILALLASYAHVEELLREAGARELRPRTPMPLPDGNGGIAWAILDTYTNEILERDTHGPRELEEKGVLT